MKMDYNNPITAVDLPKDTDWRSYAIEICRVGDLDPVYMSLSNNSAFPNHDQVKRFIVGLVTYYSKGEAAYLSQFAGSQYWVESLKRYPVAARKPMRRHFRGSLGLNAINAWRARWPQPERMMDELMRQTPTWAGIRSWTRTVPQMGNYFTWKLADLYEVLHCGLVSVDFSGCGDYMAKKSEDGSRLLHPSGSREKALKDMAADLCAHDAPPYYCRPIDMQEVETVCCNWMEVVGRGYTMGQTIANYIADARNLKSDANEQFISGLLTSVPFTEEYLSTIISRKGYK